MAKLKLYPVKGFWWLGIEINGKAILLMRKGRIGDLIQLQVT